MARILFVDDDPFTLETLKKSALILGHQALLAHSGQEAQALAVAELPDLILTDMRLPDMDGLALTKSLKKDLRSEPIAVVILSASPELDVFDLAREAGAVDFIEKPVRLQTLQDTIERYAAK